MKDLKEAKKMNDRINIINYLFSETNKNNEKKEDDFNKTVESWFNLEKQISDKKVKKMPKQMKTTLLKYFNDINNKEELLTIFKEEAYEHFKNENKKEEKIKVEKEKNDYSELKEILKYYKEYKFESKAEEIKKIEEIIKNDENNYGEYMKDLEEAKKMNDRINIINYLFNETNKNKEKKEDDFNKTVESWSNFEKQISDKKVKKMPKQMKTTLLKYFNDINNKEELLTIFKEDEYEHFKKESKDRKSVV